MDNEIKIYLVQWNFTLIVTGEVTMCKKIKNKLLTCYLMATHSLYVLVLVMCLPFAFHAENLEILHEHLSSIKRNICLNPLGMPIEYNMFTQVTINE